MLRFSLAVALLSMLCLTGWAGEVVVVEGKESAKVTTGTTIRVIGTIAAGQGEITVKVEGPGKLVATNSVRTIKNGKPLIGLTTKEFDVAAEKKGTIRITVTIENRIAKTKADHDYTVEVE